MPGWTSEGYKVRIFRSNKDAKNFFERLTGQKIKQIRRATLRGTTLTTGYDIWFVGAHEWNYYTVDKFGKWYSKDFLGSLRARYI